MNDYLTNLAARALAPSPAIVPRQGSLFEPIAPPLDTHALRQPADDWKEGRGKLVEAEPRPTAVRTRQMLARPRLAAELPTEPGDVWPTGVIPPPPAPHRAPREVPPAAAPVPQLTKVEPTAAGPPTEPPSAPAIAAPQPRPAVPSRPQTEIQPAEGLPDEPSRRESRRTSRRTVDASDDAEERGKIARPSPQPVAAREPFAPRVIVAPPSRPEHSSNALSAQPDAPPTIRVTIGRVEVRAVAPPAPAAATPKAASRPRLSLEDYLKDRSGGHR